MIAKLRPTVIILAAMAVASGLGGLAMLLSYLSQGSVLAIFDSDIQALDMLIIAGVSATIGALIGSLCTLAGQVATDPPPPSLPAKEFPDILRALAEILRRPDDKE